MLTNPGSTQVYSPFGTYVVEQHDAGPHRPQRSAVPEPSTEEQPTEVRKEMPKAA